MNAIYTSDYTASSNHVNSIYESKAETLLKLDCLYIGRDLVTSSMSKALILGGNAQEVLTAQLNDELDQLLLESLVDESNIITVSPKISDEDLAQQLLDMREHYADNAKHADDWETIIYSDIHSYDFKAMGIDIKPVIDFLTLQFEVNKSTTRSHIKKFLTEKTGTRYYIQNDESGIDQSGNVFTIQVHDIRSKKDLKAVAKCLEYYGVTCDEIKVARIEASIDFYNAKSKAVLTALYKSLAYIEGSTNERVYKNKGEFQTIPNSPIRLLDKLNSGYCIGINPRDSPIYYRSYYKTTDKRSDLCEREHRYRVEVNCAVSELGVNNSLSNLPEIIQSAFNYLKFTKLSHNATAEVKKLYRESVDMFGLKRERYYSKSRHKRSFNQTITKNAELNKVISRKVSDLKRNFYL